MDEDAEGGKGEKDGEDGKGGEDEEDGKGKEEAEEEASHSQCVAPRAPSARRANVDSGKNLLKKLATAEGNNKKLIPGQGA